MPGTHLILLAVKQLAVLQIDRMQKNMQRKTTAASSKRARWLFPAMHWIFPGETRNSLTAPYSGSWMTSQKTHLILCSVRLRTSLSAEGKEENTNGRLER